MRTSYHVAPRYTAGSPASVNQEIAEQVAEEEAAAYARALTGRYGEEDKEKAMRLGLNGIAEEVTHFANYNLSRDLLTGEVRDSRQKRKHFSSVERDLIGALEAIVEAAAHGNITGQLWTVNSAKEVLQRVKAATTVSVA